MWKDFVSLYIRVTYTLANSYIIYYHRLLDVLADRKAKKGLSGHVLINGRRQPRNFKCASAYVVQVIMCMYVCMYICIYVCM